MADKVKSADEAQKEAQKVTKESNSQIEAAAKKAATIRERQLKDVPEDAGPKSFKESFNTTDAVLGADEQHAKTIKEAQSQSLDDTFQVVTPSLNQNNLKHPEEDAYTDPHMSKNYQGQPI